MEGEELEEFYRSQLQDFPLAAAHYRGLDDVISRELSGRSYTIRLQHNPARMVSTNARIDQATLEQRPCFLCKGHRPVEQKGLPYMDRYEICINPYPIFDHHFTIPSLLHRPQRIEGRIGDLLTLAEDFPAYTVFYNGPECGASAPDHFHFQMVPRHLMPLEEDTGNPAFNRKVLCRGNFSVSCLENYMREVFVLQSSDRNRLEDLFYTFCHITGEATPYEAEPMLNILGWKEKDCWTLCCFPRKTRRPWQFYEEGERKILFSPGCVDMAGTVIAPRENDYRHYSWPILEDLFRQVTITRENKEHIIRQLEKYKTC